MFMPGVPPKPARNREWPQAAGMNTLHSRLFNGDGTLLANFDAGFTAKAIVRVGGYGFAILHFVHFHRTDVDAFAAAYALVDIHNRIISHTVLQTVFPDRNRPEQGEEIFLRELPNPSASGIAFPCRTCQAPPRMNAIGLCPSRTWGQRAAQPIKKNMEICPEYSREVFFRAR
jgi:hypothetical protein